MAKPIIYFQGWNGTDLPTGQETDRFTEETELGTKLTGSGNAKVGIFLGALTNLSSSTEFNILMTHSAENPITGVKFYFQPTTNDRAGGNGFTHTDDIQGAQDDFDEIRGWGDNDDGTGNNYGLTFKRQFDGDVTLMKTDVMDSLANSLELDNNGKFSSDSGRAGDSANDKKDFVEPWDDSNKYIHNTAAAITLQLNVPDIEDAGVRQSALWIRLSYTY